MQVCCSLMKGNRQHRLLLKPNGTKAFSVFLHAGIDCWCGNVEFPDYEFMIIVMRVLDNNHGTC